MYAQVSYKVGGPKQFLNVSVAKVPLAVNLPLCPQQEAASLAWNMLSTALILWACPQGL